MTLYEKLSKENQSKISLPSIKEKLDKEYYFSELKLLTCTALYWDIYPTKPFDLQLFFELFE